MSNDSEFRVYTYIETALGNLGWDTRNPARSGQVYTQGEFYRHDDLLTRALGTKAPENTVLVPWESGPRYWFIEAKRKHKDLQKALGEAQDYADRVNRIVPNTASFATGIAGTPDQSFYVSTTYWDGNEWQDVVINNYETTGFLSLKHCQEILNSSNPRILHYDVDLGAFLAKANEINNALHKNGVASKDRARLVAGLLLALAEDSTMRISDSPTVLVRDVNARIQSLLKRHNKDDYLAEVSLKLPNTEENHKKYWSAIVLTMQNLREVNIRSAINSGTDALGQFYETFLKYANDASEMGIVLTPRHITRFAVDVLSVHPDDVIFDPTCGTGGFLVASLDSIRSAHYGTHPDVYDAFRNDCLYGVEQADDVFGLVLVNMIFRGDGKSQIHNGNCFDNEFYLDRSGNVVRQKKIQAPPPGSERPFTRVLMNPPFAVDEPERAFVDYALRQMRPGGILFAILPNAPITGTKQEVDWRREIVKRHTVRASIKLRDDLFMPIAHKGTWALILEAWRPHRETDHVFFAILHDDESASKKSKLLAQSRARDNTERVAQDLSRFLRDGRARIEPLPREIGIAPLNLEPDYDFAAEAYLDGGIPDLTAVQLPIRSLAVELARRSARKSSDSVETPNVICDYEIEDIFEIQRGKCPPLKTLENGDIPVVTSSERSNGVAGYYDVPNELIYSNCITISANGSDGAGKAFWHPYQFSAVSDAIVCKWKAETEPTIALLLYICNEITENAWRFDYFRKATSGRILADVRISLPMTEDKSDFDFAFISRHVEQTPGFRELTQMLTW